MCVCVCVCLHLAGAEEQQVILCLRRLLCVVVVAVVRGVSASGSRGLLALVGLEAGREADAFDARWPKVVADHFAPMVVVCLFCFSLIEFAR